MSHQARNEAFPLSSVALFLDVDGTLLEIADTPGSVRVEPRILEILRALRLHTGGAVALVSGRSIADLDALFAPLSLPSAGLHGFERRGAMGSYYRCPLPEGTVLQDVREAMHRVAARREGLLVEDKRFALALHYRRAPDSEAEVISAMKTIASRARPGLELQLGKMVAELRPSSANKGGAVAAFLREPPFCGRRPIYIGDDLTDEAAFEYVNKAGGLSIAVNVERSSAASARLPNVASVHAWLADLPRWYPAALGAGSQTSDVGASQFSAPAAS